MKTEMPGGGTAKTAVMVMTLMLVIVPMIHVVIVAMAVLGVHHVRSLPGAVRVAAQSACGLRNTLQRHQRQREQ